ncbi:MAG: hypothetical protein RJA10_3789 [Pseudomonadota bacterium]
MFDGLGPGACPPGTRWGARLLPLLLTGLAGACLAAGAHAAALSRVGEQAVAGTASIGAGRPQATHHQPGVAAVAQAQGPADAAPTRRAQPQGLATDVPWWGWMAGLLAAVLPAASVVRAWRRPCYRVERSLDIASGPAGLAERLHDLRQWAAWSTLVAFGPGVERRFGGGDTAPGAAMSWSDPATGRQGHIEVLASGPPDQVTVVCTRVGAPSVRDLLTFRLAPSPAGDRTVLHCISHGQAPWLARVLDLVLPVEARKRRQLDAELAALKRAAEAAMIAA